MKQTLDHFVIPKTFVWMLNFTSIPSFVQIQMPLLPSRVWVSCMSAMCEVNRHHQLGDLCLNRKLI